VSRSKGRNLVTITWSGASTSTVDIYRDGAFRTNTNNDGSYGESFKGSGTYTYQVCDQGTNNCSAEVTVSF